MNSLSIVLVIAFAFVSYSMGASEDGAVPASVAPPKCSPTQYDNGYVEGYDIAYGNISKDGHADVTLKLHMGPNGGAKKNALPVNEILCAAMCAIQCIAGRNTATCLSCISQCVIQ